MSSLAPILLKKNRGILMQLLQNKFLKEERKKKSRNEAEVDFKLYIALIPITISSTEI